jgi:RNA polymerase sigma factor (sigma-70 family)
MINLRLLAALYPVAAVISTVAMVLTVIGDTRSPYREGVKFELCILGTLLGNWIGLLAKTPFSSVLACRITYIFVAFAPVYWIFFVRQCLGQDSAKDRWKRLLALSIVPFITIVLHFTNDFHHLIWVEQRFEVQDGFLVDRILRYGLWFWVHVLYSYTLFAVGIAKLLAGSLGAHRIYRMRAILTVVGLGVPVVADIAYLLRAITGVSIDLSPVFFSVTALCFSIVIIRYGLFTVVPPSRSDIYNNLSEGFIAFSEDGIISDSNDLALRHLQIPGPVVGSSLRSIPFLSSINLDCPQAFNGAEYLIITDGRKQRFSVSIREIQDASSPKKKYLLLTRALSRRSEADADPEEQAEAALDALLELTRQERKIFDFLVKDVPNKEIADLIGVSENTLKTHIKHIYRKLGVGDRKELLALATRAQAERR